MNAPEGCAQKLCALAARNCPLLSAHNPGVSPINLQNTEEILIMPKTFPCQPGGELWERAAP